MEMEVIMYEKVAIIKNVPIHTRVKEGERVNIKFYIKSNEFKGKFYNTLMIKELLVENSLVEESNEAPF